MSATNPMIPVSSSLRHDGVVLPPEATVVGRPSLAVADSCESASSLNSTSVGTRSSSDEATQGNGPVSSLGGASDQFVGTVVGKFRVESIIASGGMGTVYKAQQEQPVRRPVALKMIKAGMADQNTRSRFLAERQVLALMDHPDIARVYEADATEDGNPYLAMEFCDGEPIDEYCRQSQSSLRERVELVVRIARAVSRAHVHGVVHRDLKPGNILIADAGDRPQLKIIDFGIAKWTAEQPGLQVHATQIGELVGTPAYMSPEQAVGDIDARTDVFAIGAILFKLLSGTTPLGPPSVPNPSLAQVIQHIQNFQGMPPSQRFGELSVSEQLTLARECRIDKPAQWRSAVQGDLDWITLRAIEAERTRRYATASDLADDLERYLRQEPVVAAAPSRWYRWTKFYQRRKTLVWSLAMVVASLGIAASVMGYTWWRFEWQQWQETNRISTEAEVLLTQAKSSQMAAWTDPAADESAFVAARTTAAQAETLLRNRSDLGSLHRTLAELMVELTHSQHGYKLANSLDAARQASTEIGTLEAGDHFGRLAGLSQMHAAWEQFGIVPVATNPESAAQQIATLPRSLQPRIVEALDFLLYEDPFGAGLYLQQQGSRISVAEVVHGGGAERAARLRPGDRLLKIDDVSLLEWSVGDDLRAQAYRLLAGRPGQRIRVTFVRGLDEPLESEIYCGGAAAHWAHEVLAIMDSDPWRSKLRQAVLESDLSQLRELSSHADFRSQPPFSLIQLAGTLFLLERTNESLRFLEAAQQQHPQNFWANHYLGTALAVAHDPPRPDVGVRYLTSAVSLRPDSPGARINLAETLLKLGHEQEAIAHFETAQRLSPNHVPVERRLKSLLDRARVSSDLEAASRQTAQTAPAANLPGRETPQEEPRIDFESLDEVEQQARKLASHGKRREALQLVSQVEEHHQAKARQTWSPGSGPESPGLSESPVSSVSPGSSVSHETIAALRRIKGVVLLELQDYVAARVVLADAARLNLGDPAARFYHGVALEYSGDRENAIHEYEAALKIRPDYEAVREFLRNAK